MHCGIRLNPSQTSIAVITDDGGFVYETTFTSSDIYSELLSQIEVALKLVRGRYDIKVPVGICIQGHERPADGIIQSLHHPLLDQKTLRRDLQAATNHPVIIASDGQCLAVAARTRFHTDDKTTIFALSLDQFVCGGIIVADRLLSGAHGLAGDWGHLSLPWPVDHEMDGRECCCGRTGCLEHFVSLKGLSYDYALLTGNAVSADTIIKQAETGDIVAESALQVIEDRIARGLALVIGLVDPDIIGLGGVLAENPRLFANIPRKWPGYIRTAVTSDLLVPLKTSKANSDQLYLCGAAYLCDYI